MSDYYCPVTNKIFPDFITLQNYYSENMHDIDSQEDIFQLQYEEILLLIDNKNKQIPYIFNNIDIENLDLDIIKIINSKLSNNLNKNFYYLFKRVNDIQFNEIKNLENNSFINEFHEYTDNFINCLSNEMNSNTLQIFQNSLNNFDYVDIKLSSFEEQKEFTCILEQVQQQLNQLIVKNQVQNLNIGNIEYFDNFVDIDGENINSYETIKNSIQKLIYDTNNKENELVDFNELNDLIIICFYSTIDDKSQHEFQLEIIDKLIYVFENDIQVNSNELSNLQKIKSEIQYKQNNPIHLIYMINKIQNLKINNKNKSFKKDLIQFQDELESYLKQYEKFSNKFLKRNPIGNNSDDKNQIDQIMSNQVKYKNNELSLSDIDIEIKEQYIPKLHDFDKQEDQLEYRSKYPSININFDTADTFNIKSIDYRIEERKNEVNNQVKENIQDNLLKMQERKEFINKYIRFKIRDRICQTECKHFVDDLKQTVETDILRDELKEYTNNQLIQKINENLDVVDKRDLIMQNQCKEWYEGIFSRLIKSFEVPVSKIKTKENVNFYELESQCLKINNISNENSMNLSYSYMPVKLDKIIFSKIRSISIGQMLREYPKNNFEGKSFIKIKDKKIMLNQFNCLMNITSFSLIEKGGCCCGTDTYRPFQVLNIILNDDFQLESSSEFDIKVNDLVQANVDINQGSVYKNDSSAKIYSLEYGNNIFNNLKDGCEFEYNPDLFKVFKLEVKYCV